MFFDLADILEKKTIAPIKLNVCGVILHMYSYRTKYFYKFLLIFNSLFKQFKLKKKIENFKSPQFYFFVIACK